MITVEYTIFYTDLYRSLRNRVPRGETQDVYLAVVEIGRFAALAPAIFPNTAPFVRPLPPG